MATPPQLTKLAILRDLYASEFLFDESEARANWFDWVEREVGRRVQSNKELTVREAGHLIEVTEVPRRD
jgi:hypothetical protein